MRLRAGLIAVLIAVAPAAAQPPAQPDGYRLQDFRSPTPAALDGAVTVTDTEAHALWRAGETVFIDVMPRPVRPPDLPKGVYWRDPPRDSIPGALWLANSGAGALHPEMDARLRAALEQATGGDSDRGLLFFCQLDCWMSWNAAKRALTEYGYSAVYWYPAGMDGWAFEDWPVARVPPAPGF